MAIIGDSIARQQFEALEAELYPFQGSFEEYPTRTYNGNGSHYVSRGHPAILSDPLRPGYLGAVMDDGQVEFVSVAAVSGSGLAPMSALRYYPRFRASLMWCEDVGLVAPSTPWASGNWEFCGAQALRRTSRKSVRGRTHSQSEAGTGTETLTRNSDSADSAGSADGVLLIAVGTHFKASNHPAEGFPARQARSVATTGTQLHAFRQYLRRIGYTGTVVWALKPHHGPFDDLVAASVPDYRDDDQNTTRRVNKPHYEGRLWDGDADYEAGWVAPVNTLLRALAREHGDAVLDLHSLSTQLLRYVGSGGRGPGAETRRAYDQMAREPRGGGGGRGRDTDMDTGVPAAATRVAASGSGWRRWWEGWLGWGWTWRSSTTVTAVNDSGSHGGGGSDSSRRLHASSPTPPWSPPPQVHADSCHYCAGGLFRAASLLLEDLLRHRQQCGSGTHVQAQPQALSQAHAHERPHQQSSSLHHHQD